jgi:hypothetical protein
MPEQTHVFEAAQLGAQLRDAGHGLCVVVPEHNRSAQVVLLQDCD